MFEEDPFGDIAKVEVGSAALAAFSHEDDFLELIVKLLVEAGSYSYVAARTMGVSPTWDRDHAAVGGNMVRIYKLVHGLLDQICQKRGELTFIFARLLFEALVNVRFLIQEFSPATIDSYVAYSLQHERQLSDLIAANIAKRGGAPLPIEERMLKSIDRTSRASNLTLDKISPRALRTWGGKNIYERVKALGLEQMYLAFFGGGSNSIHGNWQEIQGNHLDWNETTGRFRPKMDWARPRPQLPLALGGFLADTLVHYFRFMAGETVADELATDRLDDLGDRIMAVTHAHETYLTSKTWPEI